MGGKAPLERLRNLWWTPCCCRMSSGISTTQLSPLETGQIELSQMGLQWSIQSTSSWIQGLAIPLRSSLPPSKCSRVEKYLSQQSDED